MSSPVFVAAFVRIIRSIVIAEEEWRPVVGRDGYEVSSLGRARSVDRAQTFSRSSGTQVRRFLRGKILSLNSVKGYLGFGAGSGKFIYVHSAVLEAFIGPRPPGMQACHNDGDQINNVPSNLRWDTRSGNNLDTVLHGTHKNSKKSRCPRGHEYDATCRNGTDSNGRPKVKRFCTICHKKHVKKYKSKNKDKS